MVRFRYKNGIEMDTDKEWAFRAQKLGVGNVVVNGKLLEEEDKEKGKEIDVKPITKKKSGFDKAFKNKK